LFVITIVSVQPKLKSLKSVPNQQTPLQQTVPKILLSIQNRFHFLPSEDPESEDATISQVYSDPSMTRPRIRRGKKNPVISKFTDKSSSFQRSQRPTSNASTTIPSYCHCQSYPSSGCFCTSISRPDLRKC